ncbi:MAG: peptidoglycan-binding protein [Patescibacteria group bacterium]|nr:peptidoglycan-binding protein [Patescibacteria group bacterium]
MSKYYQLRIGIGVILLFPVMVFAGSYNDVSLTTDATISLSSTSLAVSGSSDAVDSITVDTDHFSVTLDAGSTLTVRSGNRYQLNTDSSSLYVTEECTDTYSGLVLSSPTGGATATVTVTPDANVNCSFSSGTSGSGSSSRGGGGGGSTVAYVAPVVVPVIPVVTSTVSSKLTSVQISAIIGLLQSFGAEATTIANVQASLMGTGASMTISVPSSANFTRHLSKGISGDDVKTLQVILNSDSDTRIAQTGVGSIGNETDFFGSLTEDAVGRFQVKYGVANPGDPGYGTVGPKTRAKLNELK